MNNICVLDRRVERTVWKDLFINFWRIFMSKKLPGSRPDEKPHYKIEKDEISDASSELLEKIVSEWTGEYNYNDGRVELHGAPDGRYNWDETERERWAPYSTSARWSQKLMKKLPNEEVKNVIETHGTNNLMIRLLKRAAHLACEDGVEIDERDSK